MERMAGHAVRATYLNAGAADLALESGDPTLIEALKRLSRHMTARQMYISGGIDARHSGEAFGDDYELPNAQAYAESCAAIGSFMWHWRMLLLSGAACYADLMETTLYNAILVGLALDGRHYFYHNPLASDGQHRRQPWFSCACCPPNIARLLASLPGYAYTQSPAGVWIHLYAAGTAVISLGHDQKSPARRLAASTITLRQETAYPWDGDVTLEINGRGRFSLFLRLPQWCAAPQIEINGQPFDGPTLPGTYAQVQRLWRPGDVVRLRLPMPIRFVQAHPYLTENYGRVALMRGPLLYCVEQADNPNFDVRDVVLLSEVAASCRPTKALGGVVTLQVAGLVAETAESWGNTLYRSAFSAPPPAPKPVTMTAVPYYAWANREPGPMRVWLPCQPT
jgi:DUF1680 family protein